MDRAWLDDEFKRRVDSRAARQGPAWVVDGNYSAVQDIVWHRADTVLWFDLPFATVMARTVRRTVRRVVRRTELWNGNREPFSNLWSVNPQKSIIVWSATRHGVYRRRYLAAMHDPQWSDLSWIRLRTRTQVDQFLQSAAPSVALKEESSMDLELGGKVVLITGGTDGLGLALAQGLAREGAAVAICGRDEERLDSAAASIAALGGEVEAG